MEALRSCCLGLGGSLHPPLLPPGGVLALPVVQPRLLRNSLLRGSDGRAWARYLHTVFTFEALAAVVGHLVADEVGLPVEGLGTLVTLVLPLLCVDDHVLLQAVQRGQGSLQGPSAHPLPRGGGLSTQHGLFSAAHWGRPTPWSESRVSPGMCPTCPLGKSRGWRAEGLLSLSLGPLSQTNPQGVPSPHFLSLFWTVLTLKPTLGL